MSIKWDYKILYLFEKISLFLRYTYAPLYMVNIYIYYYPYKQHWKLRDREKNLCCWCKVSLVRVIWQESDVSVCHKKPIKTSNYVIYSLVQHSLTCIYVIFCLLVKFYNVQSWICFLKSMDECIHTHKALFTVGSWIVLRSGSKVNK